MRVPQWGPACLSLVLIGVSGFVDFRVFLESILFCNRLKGDLIIFITQSNFLFFTSFQYYPVTQPSTLLFNEKALKSMAVNKMN